MDCLRLTDAEIDQLITEYPCDSIEHQAGLDLAFHRDEDARNLEEMALSLAHDTEMLKLKEQVTDLRADLKELATHIRTTDGIELVHRLKLKGSLI